MATFTPQELTTLRNKVERAANAAGLPIAYVKAEINSAFQAIEDWFDLTAVQIALSNAIDTGTTFSFSNAQKKKLLKFWLENRYGRE